MASLHSIGLFLIFIPAVAVSVSNELTREWLNATDADAVCNDGSSAAMYVLDNGPDIGVWLVYLQGGGWCFSPESCEARRNLYPELISSNNFPASMKSNMMGVLSDDPNNPVATANKAFVR